MDFGRSYSRYPTEGIGMSSAPVASLVCSFPDAPPLLACLSSHSTSTTSPGFNATSTPPPICRVCEGPTVAVLRLPMLAHGCPVIDLSGGEHLQAVGARVELQPAKVEALALRRGKRGHARPQTVASSCHLEGRLACGVEPPCLAQRVKHRPRARTTKRK